MHRYLLASTAALALAAPAAAETITADLTQPIRTSTIKNGTPDVIVIDEDGSVKPASGTAVTMDSNHSVTNQGEIAVGSSNGAIGILAVADTTGDIVNSGTIKIDEAHTNTDTDNDGDLDGPFALGSNRFGIRVEGAHTGNIVNSGTIQVEGNDSGGIRLGGPLTGNFTHNGTTSVIGDRSVGVDAGAISGNVRLAGTVSVQGATSTAARFSGDISGAMVVQGGITATGYRHTTAPSNTSNLDADDLLQGGSALVIEGNVAGGVILAIRPKDNSTSDDDEDDDGIKDSEEGNAAVTSYGAAPAVLIGATDRAITLGPVAGTSTGYGLIVDGGIAGHGVYSGVDGNGLVIGGRGGAVTIANGIGITGTVAATSLNADATAVRLGSGATTPLLHNAGTISATTGNTADSQATALRIDAGASLPILRNSGTITAKTSGTTGFATAIEDLSGTLTLIENSGTISAVDSDEDDDGNRDHFVAIDLSANTSGVTIKQTVVGAGVVPPSIVGEVILGSGNDVLDLADGSVTGTARFGAGNNSLKLSGDAVYSGDAIFGSGNDSIALSGSSRVFGKVDFGGGADTLTLEGSSLFSAEITNAANLAVTVTGGTFSVPKPVSIASLNVGAGGTLHAVLDKTAGEGSLYTISGAATFADGATLLVSLGDVEDAEGRYTVLQAGSLSGLADLETDTDLVPFMFKAELATDAPANTVAIDVEKKTASELGLNRSQGAAYDAILDAINNDEDVEAVFLGITNGDQFRGTLRRMLPDHAGGAFDGVSLGSRTFARQLMDPQSPVYSLGGLDVIVSAAGWSGEKDQGETAAYNLDGLGFSAAGEVDTVAGAFGASITWFWNDYDDGADALNVQADTYELAGYWRGKWNGFNAFARGSIGTTSFQGRRTFQGMAGNETVTKTSYGEWDGMLVTGMASLSYEGRSGSFFFRPAVTIDYVRLQEDGYTERDGGDALDLTVAERTSDELAASGGLTLGFDVLGRGGDLWGVGRQNRWFRFEAEGGWRAVVGGALGATTAWFKDGDPFTLQPEENDGGWYGRLRVIGGGELFEIGGEAGAEQRHGQTAFSLRGTIRMGL